MIKHKYIKRKEIFYSDAWKKKKKNFPKNIKNEEMLSVKVQRLKTF